MRTVMKRIGIIVVLAAFTVCGVFAALKIKIKEKEDFSRLPAPDIISVNSGSSLYEMEVDRASLAFAVKEKETGNIIWSSGWFDPADGVEDENGDIGLNQLWQAFARSGITVFYNINTMYRPFTYFKNKSAEVYPAEDGFTAKVNIGDIKLSFDLKVALNDDYIDVSIPFESIKEDAKDENRLLAISVYPFFNASKGIQPAGDSYIFVPDGAGALIDTARRTIAKNNLSLKVYDSDLGINGLSSLKMYSNGKPPYRAALPVFGMASEGAGFVSRITSGAEYSEIKAYASGIVTDYNFVYNTFNYREAYTQPIDQKGAVKTEYQKNKNVFDAGIRYMLLKGRDASYSGMAARYRGDLIDSGILKTAEQGSDIPLKADFLMADSRSEVIGRSVVRMTDTDYVESALKDLKAGGVNNIYSALKGYTNGGLTNSAPDHFGFEGKTGGAAGYKKLIQYAEESGVRLYFGADYTKVNAGSGSYAQKEIAMTAGEELVSLPNFNSREWGKNDFYVLNANAVNKYFTAEKKDIAKYGIKHMQISSLGGILNSSHFKTVLSRSDAVTVFRDMLDGLDFGTALEYPNEYLLDKAEIVAQSPVSNSGYLIALETVPFYQMATGGYVSHFRNPININYSGKRDILTMLDFRVYPSYYLTENDPMDLYRTDSAYLFSSKYSEWEGKIKETYAEVNGVLKQVIGATVTERVKLAPDVYRTEYSNGVKITVNYSKAAYDTIPAGSYGVAL